MATRTRPLTLEVKRDYTGYFTFRIHDGNMPRIPWLGLRINEDEEMQKWLQTIVGIDEVKFVGGEPLKARGIPLLDESAQSLRLITNRVTVANWQKEAKLILATLQATPDHPQGGQLRARLREINAQLAPSDQVVQAEPEHDYTEKEKDVLRPIWLAERAAEGSDISFADWRLMNRERLLGLLAAPPAPTAAQPSFDPTEAPLAPETDDDVESKL